MNKNKILFIVGPTASGKSQLALFAAKQLTGSIISADSMQVYQEMDICTAKPSSEEQELIPHYFVDIIPPTKDYSSFDWYHQSLTYIEEIINQNRLPIVVGGTGFYIKNLIDGISPEISSDEGVRSELMATAESKGWNHLYQELKKKDPESAKIIHLNDHKRIIRALEIVQITGKPRTDLNSGKITLLDKGYSFKIIGLRQDRETLYNRINDRVDQMIADGLVEEVEKLSKKKLSLTAAQCLSYHEILDYIEGKCSLEKAQDELKKNTRHFAKRQLTWFNAENRIEWIDVDGVSSSDIYVQMKNKLKDWV